MSETSSLKFKTAYDEAKSTIAASLDAVKTTYDTINRDLSDEIKAADKERKELNAGLAKANKEIDSLKSTVSGLEISLSSSKELASATHKSFETEKTAHKDSNIAAAKIAKEFDTFKQAASASEKSTDALIGEMKSAAAVQLSTLEQTKATLLEARGSAKDVSFAHTNAVGELDRRLEALRESLETEKKENADLVNKLAGSKSKAESNAKEAESNAAVLQGKIAQLNTELTGALAAVADWKREADKSKADADKSRQVAEAASADKAAAQEARMLAEKDSKIALEAKARAEAEKTEKDRDAKEGIAAAVASKAATEQVNKALEALTVKYETISQKYNETSETSKVAIETGKGRISFLEATLAEREVALAALKDTTADGKRKLTTKLQEESTAHQASRQQFERLKQESYTLYTAYTGCNQQLEEYRVALERESQESARLHQALATQKQEAARDALRPSKANMMLPPSSLASLNGAGGGFESFANFHGGNAANISEFNDGSSPASGKGTPGRDRGENSFAVD